LDLRASNRKAVEWVEEQVDGDAEVMESEKRYAWAMGSREYWDYLIKALEEMGERIDSAGMLTAIEEKRQPPTMLPGVNK
jgi:hypothetical protein